jgi:RNase P/RNase MRP subunit p29
VDESKNMLRIDIGAKIVFIPKAYTQLSISGEKKDEVVITGESILGRPEDRIGRAK